MKIKRLYLLGIGLMFTSQFLTSCHDLLEKDPTDSYSETVAWSSESSLDMYVTYLYKPLNGLSNFSSLSLTDGEVHNWSPPKTHRVLLYPLPCTGIYVS